MAYTKQTWADGLAGATPLSAARMNYVETGIFNAHANAVGTGRNPLTGMFHVDGYGAVSNGSTDCWNAIQTALDEADNWNRTTNLPIGSRGGTVFVPCSPGGAPYMISKALIMDARVHFVGQGAGLWGGRGCTIRAMTSGDFTNGANTDKWMLKLTRNAEGVGSWMHSGGVEGIEFDANLTPGLGPVWGVHAGEVSRIDRIMVTNSGVTNRSVASCTFNSTDIVTGAGLGADALEDMAAQVSSTVFPTYTNFVKSDAVTTTGSAVITIPSGGVTTALIGAEAIAGTAGFRSTAYVVSVNVGANTVTMSEPLPVETAAGSAKTLTLGRPRNFRIIQVLSATSIRLNRPVPFSGTGTLSIDRPRPGARFDGWTATGFIGSINTVNNSGAGVEFTGSGSNLIGNIAGDNNGGALIRFYDCASAGDSSSTVLQSFKSENNNYGDITVAQYEKYADHDPVILIDHCGMFNLEIEGGVAYAGDRYSKDVIRIQDSTAISTAGYPSLTVKGVEADNPWNVNFENLIRDLDTGKKVTRGSILTPASGGRFYPTVFWNKDSYQIGDLYLQKVLPGSLGGNLTVEGTSTFQGPMAFGASTVVDLGSVNITSTATTQAAGDKIALSGGSGQHYGFGWQTGRIVMFGPGGTNVGFSVRNANAVGQKSSGTDAVTLLNSGKITAISSIAPGDGTNVGAAIYSGTAAPAISAALGDIYIRKQAPVWRQMIYICTTASSATTGAWTPYEDIIQQNSAPDSWEIFGYKQPPIITSGTWTTSYVASMTFTHIGYNLSNTQNNEYRWMANLAKGTYRFDAITDKGSDRAIGTWEMSFDGGTTWTGGTNGLAIGTFDLYAAAPSNNNIITATGLVLPQSGPVLIRLRNPTRNASNTTGWFTPLANASLQRTA